MGVANPLDAAYDAISNLEDQFSELSLDNIFPNIENPLMPMDIGTPLNIPGGALNLPNVDANLVANQGGNIPYNQFVTMIWLNKGPQELKIFIIILWHKSSPAEFRPGTSHVNQFPKGSWYSCPPLIQARWKWGEVSGALAPNNP